MQSYDSFQFHGFFHPFEEFLPRYVLFAHARDSWSYRLRFGGCWWCWLMEPSTLRESRDRVFYNGRLSCRLRYVDTIVTFSECEAVSNKIVFEIARWVTSRNSGGIKWKKNVRGALVFLLNSAALKFPLGRNLGHSTSRLAWAILLYIPHRALSAP